MKKIHIAVIGLTVTAIASSVFYSGFRSTGTSNTDSSFTRDPVATVLVKDCSIVNEAFDAIFVKPFTTLKKRRVDNGNKDVDLFSENLITIQKSSLFQKLLNQSLSEDNCGAGALQTLSVIYEYTEQKDKKKEVHDQLIAFAEKNIPQALFALCEGGETNNEAIKYCLSMLRDKTNVYPIELKKLAGKYFTGRLYMLNSKPSKEQIENLAEVCEASNSSDCYFRLDIAANALLDENEKDLAIGYLNKIIKFVEDNKNSNEKDKWSLSGLPSLYAQTNQEEKLIEFCSDLSTDDEYKSDCDLQMTAQGEDLLSKEKYGKAFHLFKAVSEEHFVNKDQADNQTRAEAKSNLGWMYFQGFGTDKNYNEAKYWLKESLQSASRETKALSFGTLSHIYYGENDRVGAFRACKQAAELGNSFYQAALAMYYYYGDGTIQDYKEAYAWASVAISTGGDATKPDDGKINYKNIIVRIRDASRLRLIDENRLDVAEKLAREHYNTSAYGASLSNK